MMSLCLALGHEIHANLTYSKGDPTMNKTVRRAELGDMPEIIRMLEALHQMHYDHRPDLVLDTLNVDEIQENFENEDYRFFVSINETGDITGIAYLWNYVGYFIFVKDLYVDPQYRGQGYGALLLEAAKQWAVEEGYSTYQLGFHYFNQKALGFYERVGMKKTKCTLEFNISESKSTSPPPNIRAAESADIESIIALLKSESDFMRMYGESEMLVSERGIDMALEEDDRGLCVLTDSTDKITAVLYYIIDEFEDDGNWAEAKVLRILYIHAKSSQEHDYLVEFARRRAVEINCDRMEVEVHPTDTAIDYYKRLGAFEQSYGMVYTL